MTRRTRIIRRETSFTLLVVGRALPALLMLAACDEDTNPVMNPPVTGWNCSLAVSVDGETKESFLLSPTSTSSSSDALLYNDGGVACELTATHSGSTVMFVSTSMCGNQSVKRITMTWDVDTGTITGSSTGDSDGGTGSISGSCGPVHGAP